MKTLLTLSAALIASIPVHGQIFRPEAGRARGHAAPHRGSVQVVHRGAPHGAYIYRHAPAVYVGYRPAIYGGYGYYPGYGVDYPYYGSIGYDGAGSAAANGFWLGALAGGIIGHNSGTLGHNGWRGAAWGAGAGWLLGSVVDANRRTVTYAPTPAVVPAQTTVQPAAQAPTPQQVTIINNYYTSPSPMSGANNLFGR